MKGIQGQAYLVPRISHKMHYHLIFLWEQLDTFSVLGYNFIALPLTLSTYESTYVQSMQNLLNKARPERLFVVLRRGCSVNEK